MKHLTLIVLAAVYVLEAANGYGVQQSKPNAAAAQAAHGAAQTATDARSDAPNAASAPVYTATPAESSVLHDAAVDAQLWQRIYSEKAQSLPEFAVQQQKANKFFAECAKVRAGHKWPEQIKCDIQITPQGETVVKFCDKLPCMAAEAGAGAANTVDKP